MFNANKVEITAKRYPSPNHYEQQQYMIHRILGYLWYKTEYLIRHSDSWHVPDVLSIVIMFYGVDIALIYWAATSVNPGPLFLLAFPLIWIILYIYYHYKRRYLKIREDESYKKYSNIWAILFLILPFIILIVLLFMADKFYMPY